MKTWISLQKNQYKPSNKQLARPEIFIVLTHLQIFQPQKITVKSLPILAPKTFISLLKVNKTAF